MSATFALRSDFGSDALVVTDWRATPRIRMDSTHKVKAILLSWRATSQED
ncbi:MAG: hypothetical protein AB7K71_02430 [Polyangiaceae bacterium]